MLDVQLLWLVDWYSRQCDGNWEQLFGLKLSNLNNPGWKIKISVQETELKNKMFQEISIERSDNDWVFCSTENGFFLGYCGTFNLEEMLKFFRGWVES